jgi:hypothetical protein
MSKLELELQQIKDLIAEKKNCKECNGKKVLAIVAGVVVVAAAIAGIVYAVYKFLTPNYEDFEDDFDDDFFEDEDEEDIFEEENKKDSSK